MYMQGFGSGFIRGMERINLADKMTKELWAGMSNDVYIEKISWHRLMFASGVESICEKYSIAHPGRTLYLCTNNTSDISPSEIMFCKISHFPYNTLVSRLRDEVK